MAAKRKAKVVSVRKPTTRKTKPIKTKASTPYVMQVGRSKHLLYRHRFESEKKARAAANAIVEGLEPDLRRFNSAGVAVLKELRADIEVVVFDREPSVVCRVIDDHTKQDVYFEFWRESL